MKNIELQKKLNSEKLTNKAGVLLSEANQSNSKEIHKKIKNEIDEEDEDQYDNQNVTIKGRKYFFYSICQLCRSAINKQVICCINCKMVFYCSKNHMQLDGNHKEFCAVLTDLARKRGGHLYQGSSKLSSEEFRTYRIINLNTCQNSLMRPLYPYEQEIILFPKLCNFESCRESRQEVLDTCSYCGEIAFCKNKENHFKKLHYTWCSTYSLLKEINIYQEKNGQISPILPVKILTDHKNILKPTMDKLFKLLDIETTSPAFYSCHTLTATGPLTAWYGLKLTDNFNLDELVVHLIGAEMEFELDSLNKWEAFFMHIIPKLKKLKIIFVGPELNYKGKFSQNTLKMQLCKYCKKHKRNIDCQFEKILYHEYCGITSYQKPNLICFYNPGLHRSTGFQDMDTWPLTIKKAAESFCPIIITSYTQYESYLDLKRFLCHSNRFVNIIQPPSVNPFSSKKPERNFISDERIPMIFKNFYSFILQ